MLIFYLLLQVKIMPGLLNIRGRDSNYTPIPNSYILIDKYKN